MAIGGFGALGGGMLTPEEQKALLEEKRRLEKEQFGTPTFFVNRFTVQPYPDGGFRITFAEQFSSDANVPSTARASVFMHTVNAITLVQTLVNMLPPGSVTVPPPPPSPASSLAGLLMKKP